MKKFSIMALAIAAAFSASAQIAVVKEAERAAKSGQEASKVIEIITPAFSDPSTAQMAQTWYIPGQASFAEYDQLLGKKQLNMLPENGDKKMGSLLIAGYDYFNKALPLDSLPDAKGKVKPKFSKKIYGTIAGHINDYAQAGIDCFNGHDYENSYRLFDIYITAPENPELAKALGANSPNDTIKGQLTYYQSLAANKLKDYKGALDACFKARDFGYKVKDLYDNALWFATELGMMDTVFIIAKEAHQLYGKEDATYIGQVANYYLQKKDFDNAFKTINEAIAQDPNNAQYYVVLGVLYENDNKRDESRESFKKAAELDDKNFMALHYYGRALCDQAFALNDTEAPTTQAEYDAFFNDRLVPLFKEAAEYLEKAYDVNPDNMDNLRYLEQIYYNLKDEAKYQDVQNRMK